MGSSGLPLVLLVQGYFLWRRAMADYGPGGLQGLKQHRGKKNCYLLLLMNSMFKHLQRATVFTKNDLCNGYNPVCKPNEMNGKPLILIAGTMNI